MRTAITIIVTAIAVSLAWFWTLRYKPNWIAKVMLDKDGFPRIKKAGDRFVVGGNLFFFNDEQWIQLSNVTGFPINPAPKEGDTFIIDKVGYKFTNGNWVKITGPSENEDARQNAGCWCCIAWDKYGFCTEVQQCNCKDSASRTSKQEAMAVRKNQQGRVIDGAFVPFSTIDKINAANPNLRAKCERKTGINLQTGTSYTYFLYGGHEVSLKDCMDHNAL